MVRLSTTLKARILKHDPQKGLSTLRFDDAQLRVPKVAAPEGSRVAVEIDASDVAIALSRPMDVSITNRLPGTIVEVEHLEAPYARVTMKLGVTYLHALVTWESVERLALVEGLKVWAMIKTVAILKTDVETEDPGEARFLRPRTTN